MALKTIRRMGDGHFAGIRRGGLSGWRHLHQRPGCVHHVSHLWSPAGTGNRSNLETSSERGIDAERRGHFLHRLGPSAALSGGRENLRPSALFQRNPDVPAEGKAAANLEMRHHPGEDEGRDFFIKRPGWTAESQAHSLTAFV